MGADSGTAEGREKGLNLLKWVNLAGDIVIAILFVVLLSDLGVMVYALAIFFCAQALFGFFVLFPWLIKRGRKKSV